MNDNSSTSAHDDAVGLSNDQHSDARRRLLDLMNRLHNTGVQADIEIPMIAVIGNQSAGKSSLIESISGITLPRATGTCTRCPTECKLLRSSDPWVCKVVLRFTSDAKNQALGQPVTVEFGAPMTDKTLVEERIRRAQRAILNPSVAPRNFLLGDDIDVEKPELSFSTNCVQLEISGPTVADLSFCDLPGLIASTGSAGKPGDIKLIEHLVTSYISKSTCVILLTVTCETDFENQGAHHLAKVYDPEGKRTIGVLTKPDRIDTGEEEDWLQFIRNEREPLDNGWFCVKQPSSQDIKQGVTYELARERENEFFLATAPWCNLDPILQTHLRTPNLVERASSVLSDLISKRLPEIQNEIQSALQLTEQQIGALPKEPSTDPLNEIMDLLTNFCKDLTDHIDGTPDENGLVQEIRPKQEEFQQKIRRTAPDFKPYEQAKAAGRSSTLKCPDFLLNEPDGGEVEDQNLAPIYIDQVYQRAQKARSRELPDNYPFVVRSAYVSEITKQWGAPAKMLCDQTHKTLSVHIKRIVHDHFALFGQGTLEQRVHIIIQNHLQQCRETTDARIDHLLQLEARPYTLNNHYLADYKEKYLAYYKGSRFEDSNPGFMQKISEYLAGHGTPETVDKVMSGLTNMGLSSVSADQIPKLLGSDPMDPALHIMAEVRAYFHVAYKRFIDNVPLTIDFDLVLGAKDQMFKKLREGLGIMGPNGKKTCEDLTRESPHVAGRREELRKKRERLHAASHELLTIGL
ncbi:hypothetical protein HGRIS_000741 [Hohenbuehelia grisea]|uniref:Interferon-induced GTP-binding protein Mx n=1 Tax=Hohenbuehelia grisea TaxID=104357 RepID=A0ABR3IPK9_9AGAR